MDYSPWNSLGQNTGVDSLSLLQGVFPTQGSNPRLLRCRWILYQLSHKGSPRILEWVAFPFYSWSSRPRNWTGFSYIAGRFLTNWAIREAHLKNWCFWTVLLEKTLESPLDLKEIQPVYPKGDQSWVFIGRPDVEAETPILWPPHVKNWLIGKDRNAGKDWGQEEKETTEDEMAGWHHRLNGNGFG